MTDRLPVSTQRPIWYDSQDVDQTDLTSEQLANEAIQASIINNHIGDGILPEVLVDNVIFDSSLFVGLLDGLPITAQNQPTDNNFGNQLSINLTNSNASGSKQIKICIIGLDFQSNLQYEVFYFKSNETQTTRKHFSQVLLLLFNDFIGNPSLSFNLGGNITISEATPMTVSRDVIMVAQDQQPSLFWRDFFLDPSVAQDVQSMIQSALPLYNTANLNIYTTGLDVLPLLSGDVTTQIGEKFLATTNNIQKVSLLLSVRNLTGNSLVWTGDIVVTIYPLQSGLSCSTDLVPNLPIEFSPSNIPLAQISYSYSDLGNDGIVLNSVPQPVDFIFSNTSVANGNLMSPGQYYAVTMKRSGAAGQCDILMTVGQNLVPNSRITTFSGSFWVDLPSENLWFRIYTDAAKISDGQAYDAGNGVIIPKTTLDPITQSTIDNIFGAQQFVGGNQIFSAVLSAVTEDSVEVADQRTGDPISSRQQYVPQVVLTNPIDLANLEKASSPLILGSISDQNVKSFTTSQSLMAPLYSATFVNDELLIKVITDPTDRRYSSEVISFVSDLLNGSFVNASIITNTSSPSILYRIASARLCTMMIGDVDGNGIIDDNDLSLLNDLLGFNLNVGLPLSTAIIIDGYALDFNDGFPTLNGSPVSSLDGYTNTTFVNGYKTLIQPFANLYNVIWQLVDPNSGSVVADGYDGVLIADPNNFAQANFTSTSELFNTIVGISSYNLVILSNGANSANLGGWKIVGLDVDSDILTIQKVYLTGDVMGQILRADIDGDLLITSADGYLLGNYIDRLPNSTIPSPVYPAPATNPYANIGSTFQVIRLRVEEFADREDDYASDPGTRALSVHPSQDIFGSDSYLASHKFYDLGSSTFNPITVSIGTQLAWEQYLVVSSSQSKYVPSVFSYESGFVKNPCSIDGVQCSVYPPVRSFDPGRIDYFIPNNLIIGQGGELQRPDGDFYKVDFEVGTVILEIPDGLFGSEKTIDIIGDFIATTSINGVATGLTKLGFPAMKFADCSFANLQSLSNNQLRFSVSVQSFSPNTNGLSSDGYYGAIVDGKMGVSLDYDTGLLTLNFTNLYQDAVLETLSTKVQVNVFLKKGGFNNTPLFVDSNQVGNILSLISVFSGANVGGPSALVQLGNDVSGILSVLNGGTGLNAAGPSGYVLTSNGSTVSWQPSSLGLYAPSVPSNWSDRPPTTIQEALDRIAAQIKPIA